MHTCAFIIPILARRCAEGLRYPDAAIADAARRRKRCAAFEEGSGCRRSPRAHLCPQVPWTGNHGTATHFAEPKWAGSPGFPHERLNSPWPAARRKTGTGTSGANRVSGDGAVPWERLSSLLRKLPRQLRCRPVPTFDVARRRRTRHRQELQRHPLPRACASDLRNTSAK